MKFVYGKLIVVILFFNMVCEGQNTNLFLKTDIGLSSMNFKPGMFVSPGFGCGIGMEYKIKLTDKSLSLNPAISLIRTAYAIHYDNKPDNKVAVVYVKMDLPLIVRLYDGNPSHTLLFGIGPFVSVPLSGHYYDSATRKKMTFGNATSSNLRKIDAGIVSRLTISHFANSDILMSVQYNHGIMNVKPQHTLPETKMRSRNVYISFLIPVKWSSK